MIDFRTHRTDGADGDARPTAPAPPIESERAPAGQPFDPSPLAYPAEADETRDSRHEEWRHLEAMTR
jgi:hypothetical protein